MGEKKNGRTRYRTGSKKSYLLELEGKELETLALETLDDLTNETALDTVGLDLID